MRKCKFFRWFFPDAPYDSWYWSYSQKAISENKNIMHTYSPVKDTNGDVVYVIWVEEIGY